MTDMVKSVLKCKHQAPVVSWQLLPLLVERSHELLRNQFTLHIALLPVSSRFWVVCGMIDAELIFLTIVYQSSKSGWAGELEGGK